MSFYGDMLNIQNLLDEKGIPSIVPAAEDQYTAMLSLSDFETFKRRASFKYLKIIRDPKTVAVLAINRDKHGLSDYIGPNTFAEIAVAFAQRKRIFLLQGLPKEYIDELQAWGVISLDGSLSSIFQYYKAAIEPLELQMNLFEDL